MLFYFILLVSIMLTLLYLNKKINSYLKKHIIVDAIVGTTLVLSVWFVGSQFIDWRLSAIIALLLTYIVEK